MRISDWSSDVCSSDLGLDIPKYMIATCVDATVLESLGVVIAGSFLATTSDGDSADAGTYAAMIEKYAPDEDIDTDPIGSAGVAAGACSVINVVRAKEGLTGHLPHETAQAHMKETGKASIRTTVMPQGYIQMGAA